MHHLSADVRPLTRRSSRCQRSVPCLTNSFSVFALVIGSQLLSAAISSDCIAEAPLLKVLRQPSSKTVTYKTSSPSELRAAERLFRETLTQRSSCNDLESQWRRLGFQIVRWNPGRAKELWIIREIRTRIEGRGTYAIRTGATLPVVLQAPHGFYDRHTRAICANLIAHSNFMAAAWNTAHRSVVDVAHEDNHYLNAFTRAVIQERPHAVVVQLHGFDDERRTTLAGQTAGMIVSNGSHQPSNYTIDFAHSLQRSFPAEMVRLFPWSVRELGATTNSQAAVTREYATAQFLSVELSRPVRELFRQDAEWRDRFSKVLSASVRPRATEENFNGREESTQPN